MSEEVSLQTPGKKVLGWGSAALERISFLPFHYLNDFVPVLLSNYPLNEHHLVRIQFSSLMGHGESSGQVQHQQRKRAVTLNDDRRGLGYEGVCSE